MVAGNSVTRITTAWLLGGGALIGTGALATALGYLAQFVGAWAGVSLAG